MKEKRIAIIGHFGGEENFTDGQTVKTKTLYEELSKCTHWKINKVDTYYKKKNPIKLLLQTLSALLYCKDVIVLLSGNGMQFYFPLLSFASKLLRTRVYHDVIGGNLHNYLKKHPKYVGYLNAFQVNWVETQQLKAQVNACGVNNCEVIPNFKCLDIASKNVIFPNGDGQFRFCTFSRVIKEKGIEDAINAVESINADAKKPVCSLDIYGQIGVGYENRFDQVLNEATEAIHYKGVVPFNKSVETIKEYSALLFPSYWDGEGFPGTILDAFSAGLPVIATDWNCNGELVQDGITGILYSRNEKEGLKNAITRWMKMDTAQMRKNCLIEAQKYAPEKWIGIIVKCIESKGKQE